MPLPFILWGAAALAGVVGIGAGISGKSDMDEANEISQRAKGRYDEKEDEYKDAIEALNENLEELGKERLKASSHIQILIESLKQIGNVDQKAYNNLVESVDYTKEEMQDMDKISLKASEIVNMGFNGLGTGVAAGMGAVGLATTIGVASTGTAISGLAGAAATNATLAWLGGGALSTGGAAAFGMTGGAVALGGIFLAPVALIGGFTLASKGEKALTEAKSYAAKAEVAIEELDTKIQFMERATDVVDDYILIIQSLDAKAMHAYQNVSRIVNFYLVKHQSNTDDRPWWKKLFGLGKKDYLSPNNWSREDQESLKIATHFAHTIKELCSVQIIDQESVKDNSVKLLTQVKQEYMV
jgi:hypothetical protein